jgi:hypothetical protein
MIGTTSPIRADPFVGAAVGSEGASVGGGGAAGVLSTHH